MNALFKHSRIRLAFVGLCIIAILSSVDAQDPVIRVETEIVSLNVVVMDRQGRRISGLTKDDFEVYEDGLRQEITHFTALERPLRLVLVFDVSISMEAVLPMIKQEALALLGNLRPDDKVSVVTFAGDVHGISGWLNKEKAEDIIETVTSAPHIQPLPASISRPGYRVGDNNTYLYEAFRYLFERFQADIDRIAVVMFSDGVDTGGGRTAPRVKRRAEEVGEEVLQQALESWAIVYPIRYKTEQAIGEMPEPARRPFPGTIRIGPRPVDPGHELFARITVATGGAVFDWTTRQDLIAAVGNALADLRSQYGIGYAPPRTNSGKGFRRVKVRVNRPNLVVRTREGYFYDKIKR